MTPREKRLLTYVAGAVVLILLVDITGQPIVFLFQLATGWIGFLRRVIPQMRINGAALLTAIVCLAGVLILGHAMAAWFYRERNGGAIDRRWKPRWTTMIVAGVVLMFACGLAATGIAHQTAWLARSKEPLFYNDFGRAAANRVKCVSNMTQIGHEIQTHADAHDGRLPDSLEDLKIEARRDLTCPSDWIEEHADSYPTTQFTQWRMSSYVYHGRGLKFPLPPTRPLLCEPIANHQGKGMNILFGDLTAKWCPVEDAEKIMRSLDDAPGSNR